MILISVSGVSQNALNKRQGSCWTNTYADKYCALTFTPRRQFKGFKVDPTSMSALEETIDTGRRSKLHAERKPVYRALVSD